MSGSEGENEETSGLFGTKLLHIPCFKTSFFTGVGGGVVMGLGHFMMTSKPRASTNFGFASYVLLTAGSWIYCRRQWADEQAKQKLVDEAIKTKMLYEGGQFRG